MKPDVNKKSIKPGNKALALFSKLRRLGMAGFTSHQPVQSEEKIIPAKKKQTTQNKAGNPVPYCQNQEHCQKQFNCQPGKYHSCHSSIDLWFYVSGQG